MLERIQSEMIFTTVIVDPDPRPWLCVNKLLMIRRNVVSTQHLPLEDPPKKEKQKITNSFSIFLCWKPVGLSDQACSNGKKNNANNSLLNSPFGDMTQHLM